MPTNMNKPGNKGIKRLVNAFFFSIDGFKAAFKNEEAFRMEVYLLPFATILACFLADTKIEFVIMFLTYSLILFAELINSAIENVVDRISYERHILSKQAKDIGSAIVFVAVFICLVSWLCIILL